MPRGVKVQDTAFLFFLFDAVEKRKIPLSVVDTTSQSHPTMAFMGGRKSRLRLLLFTVLPLAITSFCRGSAGCLNRLTGFVQTFSIRRRLLAHEKPDINRQDDSRLLLRLVPALFISVLASSSTAATDFGPTALLTSSFFGDVDLRFFLAGGVCAAFSHGITTPIDVIKTRQQINQDKYGGSVAGAAKIIVQEEGASALLKGFGPTIVGYGIEGAAKFGFYESLKPIVSHLLHLDNPAISYLIASVVAGAAASFVLCPLERTRIRLVTDLNFASNPLTGIPLIVRKSGVWSLFSGYPAMLSKQVPYTLGKQVSFDEVAKYLYSVVPTPSNPTTKLAVSFVSASFASIAACLLSQPGDVILTDTYKEKGSTPSPSIQNVTQAVYDRQGIQGFYSGLTARILQVGAIITSQLLLYDYVKQALGLPATGAS